MASELTVNGRRTRTERDPDTPLLWILRDELGLTGAKFGCGVGACGACTVLVGKTAVRSCTTMLADVGDTPVTTIEGLGQGKLHPLQQAWVELRVPQCGYCQAGQIMQAAGLLGETPRPTDDQIDEAMSGNICRCGTYTRIRSAIRKASAA